MEDFIDQSGKISLIREEPQPTARYFILFTYDYLSFIDFLKVKIITDVHKSLAGCKIEITKPILTTEMFIYQSRANLDAKIVC